MREPTTRDFLLAFLFFMAVLTLAALADHVRELYEAAR